MLVGGHCPGHELPGLRRCRVLGQHRGAVGDRVVDLACAQQQLGQVQPQSRVVGRHVDCFAEAVDQRVGHWLKIREPTPCPPGIFATTTPSAPAANPAAVPNATSVPTRWTHSCSTTSAPRLPTPTSCWPANKPSPCATPIPDDELLSAELARLDRKIEAADTERRRLIDLYQGGFIELPEMQRRATEVSSRRKELQHKRTSLAHERTALARDNQLRRRVHDFAARIHAVIDTLDDTQKQQLLRLLIEDVRVTGWHVQIRLRIALDPPPPADPTGPTSPTGKPRHHTRAQCQAKTVCVPLVTSSGASLSSRTASAVGVGTSVELVKVTHERRPSDTNWRPRQLSCFRGLSPRNRRALVFSRITFTFSRIGHPPAPSPDINCGAATLMVR